MGKSIKTNSATRGFLKIVTPITIQYLISSMVGASDAYMKDDIVSFEDSLWISTCDNNVWQPGVYGWEHYSCK